MSVFIPVLIALVVLIVFIRICVVFKNQIFFYATGFDSGFKLKEINLLWRLAEKCDLEDPLALYVSLPALNSCIALIIKTSRKKGNYETYKIQRFLEKLYNFRTKVALNEKKHQGLENSRQLSEGQKLRIILKGNGVFSSRILGNGRELVVSLPSQYNQQYKKVMALPGEMWKLHEISVYLWRKSDANYVFDTVVLGYGDYKGQPCLYLRQSDSLERNQKRRSVRSECSFNADMYFINSEVVNYKAAETESGFKCIIEDISEDGAMIRIGGKGKAGVRIKLQFNLNSTLIMMYGVIRSVEYNRSLNQSRLHFECTYIESPMKNEILTYVYKIIPDEEKELQQALRLLEKDREEEITGDVSAEENAESDPRLENKSEDVKIETESHSESESKNLELNDKDFGILEEL